MCTEVLAIMSTQAVHYPANIDGARRQLQVFGLCGIIMSLLGIVKPSFLFKSVHPILEFIGKHTGLAVIRPPTTPREYALNAFTFAFSLHIGYIYLFFSGPLWNRGGRVIVEAGLAD
ncbi:hypothetical protein BXZ70DRAFT_33436 [Cristinia sonorae]|uniref:Uncharacterized protein n=1 Tax=Cristinia sonorae TaxID=1940300 RepID=A0A8K0V2E4_9AGAR|nr:hypothetical protein BXZ70DRAFT_33436 [Cristinia sonorae]